MSSQSPAPLTFPFKRSVRNSREKCRLFNERGAEIPTTLSPHRFPHLSWIEAALPAPGTYWIVLLGPLSTLEHLWLTRDSRTGNATPAYASIDLWGRPLTAALEEARQLAGSVPGAVADVLRAIPMKLSSEESRVVLDRLGTPLSEGWIIWRTQDRDGFAARARHWTTGPNLIKPSLEELLDEILTKHAPAVPC